MRRHFPLPFPTRRAAHQLLAQVRREHPEARLVRLRRSGPFWVGCLSTVRPLDGFWRGLLTRGRCRHYDRMDYTQRGVLDTQLRVAERLKRLLAERKMRLDPGSPIWFDGRMELPKPGEPWKLTLSSHGTTTSIELTPAELDDFLAARPNEVVSQKLGRALGALRPKQ